MVWYSSGHIDPMAPAKVHPSGVALYRGEAPERDRGPSSEMGHRGQSRRGGAERDRRVEVPGLDGGGCIFTGDPALASEPGVAGALTRETVNWELGFDWYTFTCVGCGELTHVGRPPYQALEDFWLMCEWLYGRPPVCSACFPPA